MFDEAENCTNDLVVYVSIWWYLFYPFLEFGVHSLSHIGMYYVYGNCKRDVCFQSDEELGLRLLLRVRVLGSNFVSPRGGARQTSNFGDIFLVFRRHFIAQIVIYGLRLRTFILI